MSLLTEAKKFPAKAGRHKTLATPELVELAVAYVKHEITAEQAQRAMGLKKGNVREKLVNALFSAIRSGALK